jgi:hypothetical protein
VHNLPERVRVKNLDETNTLEAMQSPEKYRRQGGQMVTTQAGCLELEIRPYAILRIDNLGA